VRDKLRRKGIVSDDGHFSPGIGYYARLKDVERRYLVAMTDLADRLQQGSQPSSDLLARIAQFPHLPVQAPAVPSPAIPMDGDDRLSALEQRLAALENENADLRAKVREQAEFENELAAIRRLAGLEDGDDESAE